MSYNCLMKNFIFLLFLTTVEAGEFVYDWSDKEYTWYDDGISYTFDRDRDYYLLEDSMFGPGSMMGDYYGRGYEAPYQGDGEVEGTSRFGRRNAW